MFPTSVQCDLMLTWPRYLKEGLLPVEVGVCILGMLSCAHFVQCELMLTVFFGFKAHFTHRSSQHRIQAVFAAGQGRGSRVLGDIAHWGTSLLHMLCLLLGCKIWIWLAQRSVVTHKEPLPAGGCVFPVSGGGLPSAFVRVDLYSKNCIQSVDPLGGKIGQNQQIDRKNLCM